MRRTYILKRGLRIAGSIVALSVAVAAVSFFFIRVFAIRDVIVDAPGMTIQLDFRRFGTNLLFLPTMSLREELLVAYPLLSDVRFEKKFPGTLVVHFVRRSTFAQLRSAAILYAIDERGLILDAASSSSGYPILTFDVGTPAIGSIVSDDRVQGSLSFLRALDATYLIRQVSMSDSQTLQAKMENTNIFLPQSGDLRAKAATLQIIIEGFRIKGTLPAVIDLRFEKPIITKE